MRSHYWGIFFLGRVKTYMNRFNFWKKFLRKKFFEKMFSKKSMFFFGFLALLGDFLRVFCCKMIKIWENFEFHKMGCKKCLFTFACPILHSKVNLDLLYTFPIIVCHKNQRNLLFNIFPKKFLKSSIWTVFCVFLLWISQKG